MGAAAQDVSKRNPIHHPPKLAYSKCSCDGAHSSSTLYNVTNTITRNVACYICGSTYRIPQSGVWVYVHVYVHVYGRLKETPFKWLN